MGSEYQELLEKLLNSDTTDVIPQSRAEYIMLTAINSLDIGTLPEPNSRMEAYLMALITKMGEGGTSSGGSLIVTPNPDDPTKATHSPSEIYEAFQSGKAVQFYDGRQLYPLVMSNVNSAIFASGGLADVVSFFTFIITDNSEIIALGPAFVPTLTAAAEVGQTMVVKSVDENGQPTEWEAVDMASGENNGGLPNWRLIKTLEFTTDVASFEFSVDDAGNAFSLSEIMIKGVTFDIGPGYFYTKSYPYGDQNAIWPAVNKNMVWWLASTDSVLKTVMVLSDTKCTWPVDKLPNCGEKITSIIVGTSTKPTSGGTLYVYGR